LNRSIGLMEPARPKSSGVSVMEASIVSPSHKMTDGQPGFTNLSEVAISVHGSEASKSHVFLASKAFLVELGRKTT